MNPRLGICRKPIEEKDENLKASNSCSDSDKLQTNHQNSSTTKTQTAKPCVILFDSLIDPCEDKHEIVRNNLAEYLFLEYNDKRRSDETMFDKKSVEIVLPASLPQQKNYIDCGLFLLHFAQLFLTNPPSVSTVQIYLILILLIS